MNRTIRIAATAAALAAFGATAFGSAALASDCGLPMEPASRAATIYFKVDSTELTAAEKLRLMALADQAKATHVGTICLIGQADKQGRAAYNDGLSQRRAEAVKRLLVLYGAPEPAIRIEARGEAFGQVLDNVLWQAKRDRYVDVVLRD